MAIFERLLIGPKMAAISAPKQWNDHTIYNAPIKWQAIISFSPENGIACSGKKDDNQYRIHFYTDTPKVIVWIYKNEKDRDEDYWEIYKRLVDCSWAYGNK